MIIAIQTLVYFRESLLIAIDRLLGPYFKNFTLSFNRRENVSDDEEDDQVFAEFDDEKGVIFYPRMYVQRYAAVSDCFLDERWAGKLEKVVDLGYHDMSFINYLKDVPGIHTILGVDIECVPLQCSSDLLGSNDFTPKYKSPLNIMLFQGNAADPDYRLIGCDAVVAIEMIEHMLPHDLERLVHTVFGFIKPWIAIFTTPNGDFNVLFKQLESNGLRRLDHFFEWSREQFHDWCSNIIVRYPEYEVSCKGIGPGPPGTLHLGCCSQLALFVSKDYHKQQNLDLNSLQLVTDVPEPNNLTQIMEGWDSPMNLTEQNLPRTPELNCTTFQVTKFSKVTQNMLAKNKIDSLVHTREVVDEIKRLTKLLNFNKDSLNAKKELSTHVWNNTNWGDNAPYWNQYYKVVREYSYPFETKTDDCCILELISNEINSLIDLQFNGERSLDNNRLEIPMQKLMHIVGHITGDTERVKDLLQWNGYEIEGDKLVHTPLVVDEESTVGDGWPEHNFNETSSDWDTNTIDVHSTTISDGSTIVADNGHSLHAALDRKVRKLRSMTTSDKDVTSELDRVVCRLMKMALRTSNGRQNPPPSQWLQCKLYDLLSLTEKAIERRKKIFIKNFLKQALDDGAVDDHRGAVALVKYKEDTTAKQIEEKYHHFIQPRERSDSENTLNFYDNNEFDNDGTSSKDVFQEFECSTETETTGDLTYTEDLLQTVKSDVINTSLEKEDKIPVTKCSWINDIARFITFHTKSEKKCISSGDTKHSAQTKTQIKSKKNNNKRKSLLQDKIREKVVVNSLKKPQNRIANKLKCRPQYKIKITEHCHSITQSKKSCQKSEYGVSAKNNMNSKGMNGEKIDPLTKELDFQYSSAKPIISSSSNLYNKSLTTDNKDIDDTVIYIPTTNIAATEESQIIQIIMDDKEETIAMRRTIGIDAYVMNYSQINENNFDSPYDIPKDDKLQIGRVASKNVESQSIFLYDLNEPSTSKGIRHHINMDVQCGSDTLITPYSNLSTTNSLKTIPKQCMPGIKIGDPKSNLKSLLSRTGFDFPDLAINNSTVEKNNTEISNDTISSLQSHNKISYLQNETAIEQNNTHLISCTNEMEARQSHFENMTLEFTSHKRDNSNKVGQFELKKHNSFCDMRTEEEINYTVVSESKEKITKKKSKHFTFFINNTAITERQNTTIWNKNENRCVGICTNTSDNIGITERVPKMHFTGIKIKDSSTELNGMSDLSQSAKKSPTEYKPTSTSETKLLKPISSKIKIEDSGSEFLESVGSFRSPINFLCSPKNKSDWFLKESDSKEVGVGDGKALSKCIRPRLSCNGSHVHSYKERQSSEDVVFQGSWQKQKPKISKTNKTSLEKSVSDVKKQKTRNLNQIIKTAKDNVDRPKNLMLRKPVTSCISRMEKVNQDIAKKAELFRKKNPPRVITTKREIRRVVSKPSLRSVTSKTSKHYVVRKPIMFGKSADSNKYYKNRFHDLNKNLKQPNSELNKSIKEPSMVNVFKINKVHKDCTDNCSTGNKTCKKKFVSNSKFTRPNKTQRKNMTATVDVKQELVVKKDLDGEKNLFAIDNANTKQVTKDLLYLQNISQQSTNYLVFCNEVKAKSSDSESPTLKNDDNSTTRNIRKRNSSPFSQSSSTCSSHNSTCTVKSVVQGWIKSLSKGQLSSCTCNTLEMKELNNNVSKSKPKRCKSAKLTENKENHVVPTKKYKSNDVDYILPRSTFAGNNKNIFMAKLCLEKKSAVSLPTNKSLVKVTPIGHKNDIMIVGSPSISKTESKILKTPDFFCGENSEDLSIRITTTPTVDVLSRLEKNVFFDENNLCHSHSTRPLVNHKKSDNNIHEDTKKIDEVAKNMSNKNIFLDVKKSVPMAFEDHEINFDENNTNNGILNDNTSNVSTTVRHIIDETLEMVDTLSFVCDESKINNESKYLESSENMSPISSKTVILKSDEENTHNRVSLHSSEFKRRSLGAMSTLTDADVISSFSGYSESYFGDNELNNLENRHLSSVTDIFERKDQLQVRTAGGPICMQAFSGFSMNVEPVAGDQPNHLNLMEFENGNLSAAVARQTTSEEVFISGRSSDSFESCLIMDEDAVVPDWLFQIINHQQAVEDAEPVPGMIPMDIPMPFEAQSFDMNGNVVEPGVGAGAGAGAGDGRGMHSDYSQDSSGRDTSLSSSDNSSGANSVAILIDPAALTSQYESMLETLSDESMPESQTLASSRIQEVNANDSDTPMSSYERLMLRRPNLMPASSDGDADVSSLDTDVQDSSDI